MSAWLVVLVFLVMAAGAGVGCWVSHREGRLNGYLKGFDDGWRAERQTVYDQLNRALYQALEQGLITQAAIYRLYERARAEVRRLNPDGTERS
jgi:hypothetical protein